MDLKGNVFDVKRFAVHDGPGVRTALFLKGCPLRCRWCHNPEGLEPRPQLACYAQKCLRCGACVKACPKGAHSMLDGVHAFDRSKCVACGACVEGCLGRALKLFGREISVDEAREIILEDRDFYKDGGGATVSGGEPLLQADFCAALFKLLKKDGVNCAVDTSGAVAWECFEKVLPYADIFLYDVKHVDDSAHRKFVGASNKEILSNLETLSTRNVPIEIRIPCVPGFNLDDGGLKAIACFLGALKNVSGARLLPYHAAHSKFEAVGRADSLQGVEPPSDERMAAASAIMESAGLKVL